MWLHPRAQEAEAGGQSQGQFTLCDEAGAVYIVRAEVVSSVWGGTM